MQDIKRELNADCNSGDLNTMNNLMTTASRSGREKNTVLPGYLTDDWNKGGSCLANFCGVEGHVCGGLDSLRTLARQHNKLMILHRNVQ